MSFKERLLDFNKRGLIQAPEESDDSFFLRCRNAPPSMAFQSSSIAKSIFDIEPDWVWVIYENKGLRFWEGGCTWMQKNHISVQLNKAFEKKSSYLGYARDEIIAHELVHVVRGYFEEPIFEEILAYQTSKSFLRRFFAPLFRTAGESLFFILALITLLGATFFGAFQKIAIVGFFCLAIGGSIRLLWAQMTFARSRRKITQVVGKERALAVMIRLTDREIIRFSKMKPLEIEAYAQKMAKIQMRWQQILGAYFIKD